MGLIHVHNSSGDPIPATESMFAGGGGGAGTASATKQDEQTALLTTIDADTGAVALANGAVADAAVSNPASSGSLVALLKGLFTLKGALTEAAPASDTASSGLNGRLQRIAQRITSMIALLPSSIGQKTTAGSLSVSLSSDHSTLPVSGTVTINALPTGSNTIGALTANQSVNVAQINGVAATMGNGASGTGVQRVTMADNSTGILAGVTTVTTLTGGGVAHDGVDSGNPVKIGGVARSSEITAVANADRTNFITDLVGKLITLPYANPENFVSGAISTAMTATTSTSLVAAPGAGLRNYITTIIVSNSHATVGTDIVVQDGTGGTTLMTIPAASVYGGAVITLPTPMRQPTTNTAIFVANVTTGSSTKVSAFGYKGA